MSATIFDIPYWFQTQAVRRNCRNKESIILRGTVPVSITHVTASEAPWALTITFNPSEAIRRGHDLRWRRDAVSYLRPVLLRTEDHRDKVDFDYFIDGAPATSARLAAMFTLGPDISAPRREFPDRWLTGDLPALENLRYGGARHAKLPPADLMTLDEYEPHVREWISSDQPACAAEAVREASRFVLVEDALFRRVPAPLWRMTPYRPLLHGEEAPEAVRNDTSEPIKLWPMHLSNDFGRAISSDRRLTRCISAVVDCHVDPDEEADLATIGVLELKSTAKRLNQAIPRLSDENLDRFKIVRRCIEASSPTIETLIEAFESLAVMLADPAFDPVSRHQAPRPFIAGVVEHWRGLLHAAGRPILTPYQEQALSSLAT